MNNLTLRIMRSLDESCSGPEYACNLLVAEIASDTPIADTREWSIRVYSECYQLLGCGVWQKPNGRKPPRKIRLNLYSDSYWDEPLCHLFLYCNGQPRWYASFPLTANYERWTGVELEAATDHPEQLFFVNHLSYQGWWCRLKQERVSPAIIGNLIEQLYHRATTPNPMPHWVVSGTESRAATFATDILAASLTDNTPKACCRFSLNDLLTGRVGWSRLKESFEGKKAVVIQVERIGDDDSAENMLDLLADWLRSPRALPCIFYGTERNIDLLLQYIPALGDLFDDRSKIELPNDPEVPMCNDDNEPVASYPFATDRHSTPLPNKGSVDTPCVAIEKLEKLIGLSRLKSDMRDAWLMARFARERRQLGLATESDDRYHMIFYGNPGTGKTTVARLVGEIYHHLGLLSNGHTVETCRSQLVGEFIGQTEQRTQAILEQARGGVLFIDEAYTLVSHNRESNDFGKEVIHALLPVLSEPHPDMIIVLAGYEEKMQTLLRSNPGLKERFPLQFHFEDYSADELHAIACQLLHEREFVLTREADQRLTRIIGRTVAHPDTGFGNGRWVHNLVEQGIVKNMARRIMTMNSHDCTDRALLSTIVAADIDRAEEWLSSSSGPRTILPMPIGFRA